MAALLVRQLGPPRCDICGQPDGPKHDREPHAFESEAPPRCDNCKHWRRMEDYGGTDVSGECLRMFDSKRDPAWNLNDDDVLTQTRPDFGCVAWEEK